MTTEVNVLNSKFEKTKSLPTNVELNADSINTTVVHQVVKALLAGRRQGTACTKNKALVSGGGKKPFKQKGTGRARQGSTRSPLMPGGGTVCGPTPRDYTQKVNKKMMNIAVHSVLADKYQAGKLFVVDTIESNGKTKDLHKVLSSKNLNSNLIVTDKTDSMALRAAKNLEKSKAMSVEGFSVYEAIKFENLIIEKAAFEKLLNRLV